MEANVNKPLLALRCKDCGKVFFAHALAYPIDSDSAEMIADCVRKGDEPFICLETTLGLCECEKEYLKEDEE
ncbi:MAG: hypothetical protein NC548_34750 [Lachnospiraceae bacterium]|nr:hypothetical protein [Lachnospiraceae bacterium]